MVGIGAEGSLPDAEEFVADTNTTFAMLWSESFDAWIHYEVRSSDDVLLLDGTGNRLVDTPAQYDENRIEQLLATLG